MDKEEYKEILRKRTLKDLKEKRSKDNKNIRL